MATRTKRAVPRAAQGDDTGQSRPPLSPDLLKRLYRSMIMSRMAEDQARLLFGRGDSANRYSANPGLEATQVGATIDLQIEDAIAPSRRHFFAHVVKGVSLKYVYAQLRASVCAPAKAECRCRLLNAPATESTISAQLNIGAGVALAFRMRKMRNVVIMLSDDASASLDAWHQALSFAGSNKLPVVFVTENNLWEPTVNGGLQRDPDDLTRKAQAYGFPVMTVDGNDVVAVYRVCYEARERARQGYGPTLVESRTCRPTTDLPQLSRPEDLERWKMLDPIPAMERYLRKQNLWDNAWKQKILGEIRTEIREALQFAKQRSVTLPDDVLNTLYWL